jgi:hypothetical protein
MRLLLKIVGVLLLLVLVIAGGGFLYFINRFPEVPPAQAVTVPTWRSTSRSASTATRNATGPSSPVR